MEEEKLDVYQKAAQFLINVKTKELRETLTHSLVLAALAESTSELSVTKTGKAIESVWHLKVPPERISRSLKSLVGNSIRKGNAGYFMDEEQKIKYHQNIKNRISFFKEAENEWLEAMQLSGSCRQLEQFERDQISEDFRSAVGGMCEKHVQKVINFLNGHTTELEDIFISRDLMECIPKSKGQNDEIINIEMNIFPLFFQSRDPRRAQYCAGIAQGYLRRTIFELEIQGKEVLGNRLKSVNIFLDTNLIFGLLGLDGDDRKDTMERLIEMNKSLGVNALVDKRSIQEFRSVLNNSRRNNIGPRVPKGIFSEVKKAIQNPGYKPTTKFSLPDDPFVLKFWASLDEVDVKRMMYKDFSARWEIFLNNLDCVDVILSEKYKVTIVNEISKIGYEEKRLNDVVEKIVQAAKKHNMKKWKSTVEHDALMFLCIENFRENEKAGIFPSNTWLLSADRSLREFHKIMLKGGVHDLAHFLPVGSWVEVMMPFLSIQLMDEKENALAVIRSLGEGFQYFAVDRMEPREVAEVLRRVPETSERGPELVLRLATNRYFKDTVHNIFARRTEPPTKEEIDEGVMKAFEGIEEKATIADKDMIIEIGGIKEQLKKSKEELEGEREARKRAERIITKLKLMGIIVPVSAVIAWVAYFLAKLYFGHLKSWLVFGYLVALY